MDSEQLKDLGDSLIRGVVSESEKKDPSYIRDKEGNYTIQDVDLKQTLETGIVTFFE